jgi:hypothetical protein
MGSHRRPKPPSRALITTLGDAAGAVSLLPSPSSHPSLPELFHHGANSEVGCHNGLL